jgi:acetyl-CoA carboxylase biotin carboxyl carrier protein
MSKADEKTSPKSTDDDSQGVDADLVRKLAELLEETGLSEIEYGRDDWHIRVSRGGTSIALQTSAPAASLSAVVADGDGSANDLSLHPGAICSPMVGVVYTSSDPDTPPFVKVGDQVDAGDTVLLVEAMKVFNPIRAPKAGNVTKILVNNGSPIEYGEPLLIIE